MVTTMESCLRAFNEVRQIHTEPGESATDPFCPPTGWHGDERQYLKLLYERWNDEEWGQRLRFSVMVGMNNAITADGPYAETAADVLCQLLAQRGSVGDIKLMKH